MRTEAVVIASADCNTPKSAASPRTVARTELSSPSRGIVSSSLRFAPSSRTTSRFTDAACSSSAACTASFDPRHTPVATAASVAASITLMTL